MFFGRHRRDTGDLHREMPRNSPAIAIVFCGELPAAGSGTGAGGGFESFEFGVVNLSGGVRAHAFEDLKDGDLLGGAVGLLERAGRDAAAVEHQAGVIEAGESHDGGGHVLVATGDADYAVERVAASHESRWSRR